MNLNPQSIYRAHGIGFWLNANGSRSAEYFGTTHTFHRTALGWQGYGEVFRTLAEAGEFIVDRYDNA